MSRGLLAAAAASLAAVAVAVTVAPAWVWVPVGLGLVLVWALWATCPPGVSLGRHLAAQAGQIVLDAAHAVIRGVVTVAIVVALLAAGWSWIQPRLAAAVDRQVDHLVGQALDRTIGRATDTVTHPGLPDLTGTWQRITKGATR